MTSREKQAADIAVAPINPNEDLRRISRDESVVDDNGKKKKRSGKSFANFLYDPVRKTVLGRDGLNWGK